MANTYKNIVITPNRGSSTSDPKIVFSGANNSTNTDITLYVYPTSNGSLSFEGSSGQLFSITNDLTGVLFSVNDQSGLPYLEVDANGRVSLVQYSGNVGIGTGTPLYTLDVLGTANVTGNLYINGTNVLATLVSAFGQANNSNTTARSAYSQANSAFIEAVAAFNNANSTLVTASSAYAQANGAFITSTSAYGMANSVNITVGSAYTQANAAFITAVAAFNQANTGSGSTAAYAQANGAFITSSAAYSQANSAFIEAVGAFSQANGAFITASAAFATANAASGSNTIPAFNTANAAYTLANNAYLSSNSVLLTAQGAFAAANAAPGIANSYATAVGTAGNTYAASVGVGANTYALAAFNQANNANITAIAAFGLANTVVASTAADFRANTANKYVDTDTVWSAAQEISLTDAATISVDMSTFINANVTLGGNRTLGQPSNTKTGQSGCIRVTQDATGSRTLAYHTDWEFAGATAPILSTAANTTDLLFYHVIGANRIFGSLINGVA